MNPLIISTKIAYLLLLTTCISCTFRDRKRSPAPKPLNIIASRDLPITASRNQEKNIVTFSFTALQDFGCEAKIWNKVAGNPPNQDNPQTISCSEPTYPAGEVKVNLSPVDPSIRYQIQLVLTAPNGTLDEVSLIENDAGPTRVEPADPTDKKLVLVRNSLPTSNTLLTTYQGANLPDFARPPTGCEMRPFPGTDQTSKADAFFVSNITTRGFGNGQAQMVQGSVNSQFIDFKQKFQWGAPWEWSFNYLGKEATFQIPAPSRFSQLKIQQTDTVHLGKPDLVSSASEKKLFKNQPFRISWESSNPAFDSTVEVWIGQIGQNNGLVCVFKESDKNATVGTNFLQRLPNGYHDVIVFLYTTHQYQPQEEGVELNWYFKSADWRVALISLI